MSAPWVALLDGGYGTHDHPYGGEHDLSRQQERGEEVAEVGQEEEEVVVVGVVKEEAEGEEEEVRAAWSIDTEPPRLSS